MTLRSFWRTGVVGLLAAAVLAGCGESDERKSAKDADAAQTKAAKELRLAAVSLNESLDDESRAAQVIGGFSKAEATLRDLIKQQPTCWQAQAQLGSVLLAKGDFYSARVSALMTQISQSQNAAIQAWRYLKKHQAERDLALGQQAMATGDEAALTAEETRLKADLATRQKAIDDSRARSADLLKLAATQADAGKVEDEAGKALVAEAEKMPLGKAQLAKMGEGCDKQSHAAENFAQAAILESQAKVLFNAEARKAAEQGLAANRVRALLGIPDEVAGHELAIDMIQGRLTELDKAKANSHQNAATTAPEGSKLDVQRDQEVATMNLEHLAAVGARLEQAVKSADEAYDSASKELTAALPGARAANDWRELNIRVDLSNSNRGKGLLHLMLAGLSVSLQEVARIAKDADLASLQIPKMETTVGQLAFSSYQEKGREKSERDAARVALSDAAWALDDSEMLARQIESKTNNKDIREGQLWTQRVLKDRRAELEKQLGELIARRQGGPTGGLSGPSGPTSRPAVP